MLSDVVEMDFRNIWFANVHEVQVGKVGLRVDVYSIIPSTPHTHLRENV